jgi:hypothetical protein
MLRPLYRCLLRLHPPGFRKRFADEILSIFDASSKRRDQLRLLFDGLLSLARQWTLRPEFWQGLPVKSEQPAPEGIPSFYSFDTFHLRPSAVIHGSVLAAALFLVTCYAIRYSWIHVLHVHVPEVQFARSEWVPASSATSASGDPSVSAIATNKALVATPAPSSPPLPKAQTADNRAIEVRQFIPQPHGKEPTSESEKSPATTLVPASQATTETQVPTEASLDSTQRQLVIDGAIKHLKKYYVDPAVAGKMASILRKHERNGDDDEATDGAAFADLLTNQMRQVSDDRHLEVVYSQIATAEHEAGPTREIFERYRRDMERTNCTFEKVAVLAHNIGYVKFNSFPDLSICQSTAAAAMTSLNETDAIIIDLRDNRGGVPAMVAFMASYLFNHPTHLDDLYNRAEHSTLQSWTLSPVVGNKLADKPAYVLISSSTFSGAEEFAYDMKMLNRATLVGETTAGGAHMVRGRRIDGHFTIRVPDTTPINPISKTNWEGTGVTPDVRAKAPDALTVAEGLALTKLQKE